MLMFSFSHENLKGQGTVEKTEGQRGEDLLEVAELGLRQVGAGTSLGAGC